MTNGKFDNSKFRSFYNLSYHAEKIIEKENDDFGSMATLLLIKYTTILKDYENSDNIKKLIVQIKKIIIKLKSIIDSNSHSVKYCIKINKNHFF